MAAASYMIDVDHSAALLFQAIPVVENHVTLPRSTDHQFLGARSASAVHDAVEAKLVFCAEKLLQNSCARMETP